MPVSNLKHFYIPEEQSIYLLSHADAQKLKDWINLCIAQLEKLGFRQIELIGKGAYGFAFGGLSHQNQELVFKFSRANLPQHVQDRLEEEAFMLGNVAHPLVPGLVEFLRVGKQAILVMERAKGIDLEQLSLQHGPLEPRLIVKIAAQLTDILTTLRQHKVNDQPKPIVHGDIKPSNIVYNPETDDIGLIDWGSSVFAQVDSQGQYIANNVMDLMSGDLHQTNARLGDVYFIGDEQLNGGLSSPRFDEQGVASTLYALASGQSCRFGHRVLTPRSLGLPIELAEVLTHLLSQDIRARQQAGDYLIKNAQFMKNMVFAPYTQPHVSRLVPARHHAEYKEIETVVYSSRKSFLRAENVTEDFKNINDAQFERYYKNYMQGMGETEKAFVSEVSRLGRFPVVGGIAVRWETTGVYIDSSLNLYDQTLKYSFDVVLNNVVNLARAIHRVGIFKSCMFNAKDTLHVERDSVEQPFIPDASVQIPYEVSFDATLDNDESRMHSYFEDGDDPDELLQLPESIMKVIRKLNLIHHTGCIIFESLALHLKIHNYYKLLDPAKEEEFKECLATLVTLIPELEGIGISGFMKLPYKDTRFFEHHDHLHDKFYPRNPKLAN